MRKKTKKLLFFLTKMLVTVALLAWLIEKVDWSTVLAHVFTLSWPWLALYCLFQLSGNVISAKKWQAIARFKRLSISLKDSFFVYLSGAFINNFLPGTIGGDAYRGLWLAERAQSKTVAFSTVIFDRFTGLWATALLALLSTLLFLPHLLTNRIVALTLGLIVLFIVADFFGAYVYKKEWLHPLLRYLPEKLQLFIAEVAGYTERRMWTIASLYAILFAFVAIGLNNYMLFLALGAHVNPFVFLSLIFLITLVSNIPISINNIGIKEWAYVTFFGLAGVSPEMAVTAALISRFLQMFLSFIALPYYIHRERIEAAKNKIL